MTQKELLYIEDAIGHEQNMIKIIEESINCLEDASLKKFIKKELTGHESYKTKLMRFLEGTINE